MYYILQYTGTGRKAQGAEGHDGAVVREGERAHGQAGGHWGAADHDHDGGQVLDAGTDIMTTTILPSDCQIIRRHIIRCAMCIVFILCLYSTNFKMSAQARNISEGEKYFFNEKELDEFADMLEGIKKWKEEGEAVQEARKNYEVSKKCVIIAQ